MSARVYSVYKLSQRVGFLLKKKGLTLAVAESCTGGLLSSSITDIPGSSKYFLLGVVAYSSSQKEKVLKIPHSIIRKYSAVSAKVSELMAKNIRKLTTADIGIGLTGYAGPEGGGSRNPVGTVYIAIAFKEKIKVKRCLFKGKRTQIKKKAVKETLKELLEIAESNFKTQNSKLKT